MSKFEKYKEFNDKEIIDKLFSHNELKLSPQTRYGYIRKLDNLLAKQNFHELSCPKKLEEKQNEMSLTEKNEYQLSASFVIAFRFLLKLKLSSSRKLIIFGFFTIQIKFFFNL